MRREILFRGKRMSDGAWVVGSLFCPDRGDAPTEICVGTNIVRISYDVNPDTVGQYTTVDDKNKVKIFEGDIVKTREFGKDECGLNHPRFDTFIVVWCNEGWCMENSLRRFRLSISGESLERIGNKWDNPELLEVVAP